MYQSRKEMMKEEALTFETNRRQDLRIKPCQSSCQLIHTLFLSLHQVNRRQDMKQLLNNSRHEMMLLGLEEKERQSSSLSLSIYEVSMGEKNVRREEKKRQKKMLEKEEQKEKHFMTSSQKLLSDRCCLILTNTCKTRCVHRFFLLLFILKASCSLFLVPAQLYLLNHS